MPGVQMANSVELLSILRLVKDIEKGQPVGFRDDDYGSRSLAQLSKLSTSMQVNTSKRERSSTKIKNPYQAVPKSGSRYPLHREHNSVPFALAWGSLPSKTNQNSQDSSHDPNNSALSLMLESPIERRNTSSSRVSNRSRLSFSTSADVLLPGAHQVIQHATESGRKGLYNRLLHQSDSPTATPTKNQGNKSPKPKTNDQRWMKRQQQQRHRQQYRNFQPSVSSKPRSSSPPSSQIDASATPTTKTNSKLNHLPLLIHHQHPAAIAASKISILHMPPIPTYLSSSSFIGEQQEQPREERKDISPDHAQHHHQHQHQHQQPRHHPSSSNTQLQKQNDIAVVLNTAVRHARQDVQSSKEQQEQTISTYSKLLPER